MELVRTVVDCDLKETCFRTPHVEHHYELVLHEGGVKEEKLRVSEAPPKPLMNGGSEDLNGTFTLLCDPAGRKGALRGCQTVVGGSFLRQPPHLPPEDILT